MNEELRQAFSGLKADAVRQVQGTGRANVTALGRALGPGAPGSGAGTVTTLTNADGTHKFVFGADTFDDETAVF